MKSFGLAAVVLIAILSFSRAETFPFGIVYGPKAAFQISAPAGWVIDNKAGADDGLPCVLYLKGATWGTAEPLMYGKIASTEYDDHKAFAAKAIGEMKKERGRFKMKRLASGKTKDGQPFFINDYAPTKEYPRHECVAYVQLNGAVAYVVFSADEEKNFSKHSAALEEAVQSIRGMQIGDARSAKPEQKQRE
ncbi:MAG TPA: hypothetical protein VFV83_03640 [Chthoniobacteraceae bacterium]|nr:hypothetical protein [Chthoniobacteraceae bacterium]